MSSERRESNSSAVNPRFLGKANPPRVSRGAKARPVGVADAQQADIPAPRTRRYDRRGDGWGWLGGVLDVPVMERGPRTGKSGPQKGEAPDEATERSE